MISKAEKIQYLKVEGNHHTVGYKIGKETASKINKVLKNNKISQDKTDKLLLSKILSKFRIICEKHFPEYYSELKGIAEGADVNFDELFAFNVREIRLMLNQKNTIGGCTTCIIPKNKKKDSFIVGHNEDARKGNEIFILNSKINSEPATLSLCYYGILPGFSVSVNEKGLFQLSDYIESKTIDLGFPFSFLSRSTLKMNNVEEAVEFITKSKRSSSQTFIFLKEGKIACIETTSKKHIIREIDKPFVHTNHYVFDEMKKYQKPIDNNETATIFRREKSQNMLDSSKPEFQALKEILSNHESYPKSICQHGFKDFNTIATVLFDTSKKELHVCKGKPCEAEFYKFVLE